MPEQDPPEAMPTAEQHRIQQLADNLLATLAAVVPKHVVHYAVEDTRHALRTIRRKVHTIGTRPPTTWTFFGHWDNDRVVVEYTLPGDVSDDREDNGTWPQGLWATSGSAATVEEAQAVAIAAYQDDGESSMVSADCPVCGLTFDTEAEYQQHLTAWSSRPNPPRPDLGDEVEDAWERYRAIRLELRHLTLRQIAETVISLVPQAAVLHLDIRYPGKVGEVNRWRYRHVCDAAGVQLPVADEVALALETDLNDLLADLARFAKVTRTGRVDLTCIPPTLTGDDSPGRLATEP